MNQTEIYFAVLNILALQLSRFGHTNGAYQLDFSSC